MNTFRLYIQLSFLIHPHIFFHVDAKDARSIVITGGSDVNTGDTPHYDKIISASISLDNDGNIETRQNGKECIDHDDFCKDWAKSGECNNNPNYMLNECKRSCRVCGNETLTVKSEHEVFDTPHGKKQKVTEMHRNEVLFKIRLMEEYMKEVVSKPEFNGVRGLCKNRDELCAFWSQIGECEKNPGYMELSCAPACQTCHMLDYGTRCPTDPSEMDVLAPGDLDSMFEQIISTEKNVTILSRPYHIPGNNEETAEYQLGPWVITIDGFISDDKCDRLIELGSSLGYERSTDIGEKKFDGTFENRMSDHRTSGNTWCLQECDHDPNVQNVTSSIAKLTGVPEMNSEYLQFLKYDIGEYYRIHHDYIDAKSHQNPGPRILTVFLYLNDVDEGGGTNFPDLNLTVVPKKGRIVVWPSVLNSNPRLKDERTIHQALEVTKGIKYASNAWLHLRDFKTPFDKNCSP